MLNQSNEGNGVCTWGQFDRQIRSKGCNLLKRLDEFPNSILIAGCQRSGTTILSRIVTQSEGMVNFWFGDDDELDAALLLSGHINHKPEGRYCFQTTYVNNCYQEYFSHHKFRLIWILRNPYSVVYSMLHHWRRSALTRLFRACGSALLDEKLAMRYRKFGAWSISRVHQACFSYNAKVSQAHELKDRLGPDRILIIDYENLVKNKVLVLRAIYDFIDLEYKEQYSTLINDNSINKIIDQPEKEAECVKSICMPVYTQAKELLSPLSLK